MWYCMLYCMIVEPHVVVYVVLHIWYHIHYSLWYHMTIAHAHEENFMQQRRQEISLPSEMYIELGASMRKGKMAATTERNCLHLHRQCTAGILQVVTALCIPNYLFK